MKEVTSTSTTDLSDNNPDSDIVERATLPNLADDTGTNPSRKSLLSPSSAEHDETHHGMNAKAANVLLAYMGFVDPVRRKKDHLLPKDDAAWLDHLVYIVKKKTVVEYLSEKELRKVIIRARPNLAGKKIAYETDKDAPICINWSKEEVAAWISECGYGDFKEIFLQNGITGSKLASVDASALNRMGMTDLKDMMGITSRIREILKIPKPNALRALMRLPPFENYLKKRVYTGKTYDMLTFEKYCKQEGIPYPMVKNNKNAVIPCTCEVRIVPNGVTDDDEEELADTDSDDMSLINAPTVEYIVRNVVLRDITVAKIIEDLMQSVFSAPGSRKYGKTIMDKFRDALNSADDGMTPKERFDFAMAVANALLDELNRTAIILNDIEQLQKYIKENITQERMDELKGYAEEFMENVVPIASLLAFGELDLEAIFKQEPAFEQFVGSVCEEAEEATNSLVPEALEFVDSVVRLAQERIEEMELPGLDVVKISSGVDLVQEVIDEVVKKAFAIASKPKPKPKPTIPETGTAVQADFGDEGPVDLRWPDVQKAVAAGEKKKKLKLKLKP